ncbi:MAG: MBOAT family protein, partial [Nannocystaceae bacterium]
GGRRRSAIRNLFAVWFLTGLWHGAGWNFIAWGLYFGFFIYLERAFLHRVLARMPVATGHLYLLTIAMIGWVLFYFEDSAQLLSHLQTMFGLNDARLFSEELVLSVQRNYFWIFLAIVSCLPVYPIVTNHIHRATAARRLHPVFAQSILLLPNVLILGIATAMLVGRSYNPFIYFRF